MQGVADHADITDVVQCQGAAINGARGQATDHSWAQRLGNADDYYAFCAGID